jgi:hypothetical protein
MSNALRSKTPSRLLSLFGLMLLLAALPGGQTWADPPDPPALTWEKLDFSYDMPQHTPSSAPISAQGTLKTFYAVADTEVRQSNPGQNYGTEPTMGAGYDNYVEFSLIQRGLVRFDVTTYLPPGATIHQATFRIRVLDSGYCDAYSATFRAYRIAEEWSELAATWNNQPSFAEGYGSTSIPVPPSDSWANFDVTALVQDWIDGDHAEYGLMLRGSEIPPYACSFRTFRTKGGGGYTLAPELLVDYTLPASALSVSQDALTFLHQCDAGAAPPTPQTLAVQSNDNTLENWTATLPGGESWLSVSKSSGKVSSIFADQIQVSVSEIDDCPSTTTAQIQISAPGLGSSPQTVQVTLFQSEDPTQFIYLPLAARNHGGSAGSAGTGSTASAADRIALIIGVADYQYLPPPSEFSVFRAGVWGYDILGPRSDDFAMLQELREDDDACPDSLSQGHATAWVNFGTFVVLPEELATKENVDYALEWIDEREDADTEILIYFSGHGGPITDTAPLDEGDGFDELLGVYDTNDEPEFVDHVLDDDFKARLAELETEHLALIIDACNSGGMEITNPHRAVLAAAQEDQWSWETSELEHGVFTYYMLQAMRDPSADTNDDGWLSVQEIFDYAQNLVSDYVRDIPDNSHEQDLHLDLTTDFNVVRCGC